MDNTRFFHPQRTMRDWNETEWLETKTNVPCSCRASSPSAGPPHQPPHCPFYTADVPELARLTPFEIRKLHHKQQLCFASVGRNRKQNHATTASTDKEVCLPNKTLARSRPMHVSIQGHDHRRTPNSRYLYTPVRARRSQFQAFRCSKWAIVEVEVVTPGSLEKHLRTIVERIINLLANSRKVTWSMSSTS